MNKEEIIERIKRDLTNDPERQASLLAAWDTPTGRSAFTSDTVPDDASGLAIDGTRVGLPTYYCYDNYSAQQYNTCGQAVIASFIDSCGKNPYGLPKNMTGPDGKMHFDPTQIVGRVFNDFGPNWPWKNGVTVRETIMAAFNSYGIHNNEWFPGAFSNGADSRAQLTDWIAKYRMPVIVLVDAGTKLLNGPAYNLHWCVVYAYDDTDVHIATWARTFSASWGLFMEAWHCWFLPYPNNYYQVRAWG